MREFFRGWRRKLGVVTLAVVLLLISIWLSPSWQKYRRNQAMFAACSSGDIKAIRVTLAAGVDANVRDANGITALMYAGRGRHPRQEDPAATDHPDVVQLLLEHGADCNATTATGFVALFWAARYGHEKVIKVLTDNGANASAKDTDGMTALRWATLNRTASPSIYDKAIAHLKKAGATE